MSKFTIKNLALSCLLGSTVILPYQSVHAQVLAPAPDRMSSIDITSYQPKATASARATQLQDQLQQLQPENYDLSRYPVTDRNQRYWKNMLWTTGILNPQEDYVARALDGILLLATAPKLSDPQKSVIDAAMQVGTQLYLSNPSVYASVGQKFRSIINYSSDPEWVSISLSTLARSGISQPQTQQLVQRVQQRFPNWSRNTSLYTTIRNVSELYNPTPIPSIEDLLSWQVAPKQPHLYVFCRPNRELLCLAVLKDRNGNFVQQDAKPWSVPLLLQSIHNLDWNFTRGQTPQGIYRIEGAVPQPDDRVFRAYGQFPLVKLFAPFESGVKAFIPGKKGRFTGGLPVYQALLPASWQNYAPMQQSYWAGKIGRSLFRIHGSGEATDFFKGKSDRSIASSANWNPALGCLSALETYDRNGRLTSADMPEILTKLATVGGGKIEGYLIVVDLPSSSNTPISLTEITQANPLSPSKN